MNDLALAKRQSFGVTHRMVRTQTRGDHMMLDRMLLRLNLASRDDYGLFLNIHHSALQDLKAEWRDEDQEDFRGMLRSLQNDLQVLGIAAVTVPPAPRAALTTGNRLGIAYVVRGSRLGASVLRQRVPDRYATSYFDFVLSLSWGGFLQELEPRAEALDATIALEVIHGARMAFQVFTRLLTQALA